MQPFCTYVLSVERHWQEVAQGLIYDAMDQRGLSFPAFSRLLSEAGQDIEPKTLARRVVRGGFDAGFLLFCLSVLDTQKVVMLDGQAEVSMRKKGARKGALPQSK